MKKISSDDMEYESLDGNEISEAEEDAKKPVCFVCKNGSDLKILDTEDKILRCKAVSIIRDKYELKYKNRSLENFFGVPYHSGCYETYTDVACKYKQDLKQIIDDFKEESQQRQHNSVNLESSERYVLDHILE